MAVSEERVTIGLDRLAPDKAASLRMLLLDCLGHQKSVVIGPESISHLLLANEMWETGKRLTDEMLAKLRELQGRNDELEKIDAAHRRTVNRMAGAARANKEKWRRMLTGLYAEMMRLDKDIDVSWPGPEDADRRLKELVAAMREARASGDEERLRMLMQENDRLARSTGREANASR